MSDDENNTGTSGHNVGFSGNHSIQPEFKTDESGNTVNFVPPEPFYRPGSLDFKKCHSGPSGNKKT